MRTFNRFYIIPCILLALLLSIPNVHYAAFGQFTQPPETKQGGPVAIGQAMAQQDPNAPRVSIIQAPPVVEQGGGLIQLKAFGWLEPYVDTLVQLLIAAGFSWFAKSRYSSYLDDTSRAALETFLKNRASSLIADGFVKMNGKVVDVHSQALADEANKAGAMIPGALKRFGLTPDVVAQKIVDAIPQVPAGAAIVATAHEAPVIKVGDIMVKGDLPPDKGPLLPPTSGAES